MPDELPILLFATPAEFEAWLEESHAESRGLWLKIAKKGTEPPSVTYAEALELALCFGWIDSQKRGLDERHFLQRFTPRRPRGRWSKINREKAEALLAAGAMRPAGLAEVEADGAIAGAVGGKQAPAAVLVRPDSVVAWAGGASEDLDGYLRSVVSAGPQRAHGSEPSGAAGFPSLGRRGRRSRAYAGLGAVSARIERWTASRRAFSRGSSNMK